MCERFGEKACILNFVLAYSAHRMRSIQEAILEAGVSRAIAGQTRPRAWIGCDDSARTTFIFSTPCAFLRMLILVGS
jgi:hypothetical protein